MICDIRLDRAPEEGIRIGSNTFFNDVNMMITLIELSRHALVSYVLVNLFGSHYNLMLLH